MEPSAIPLLAVALVFTKAFSHFNATGSTQSSIQENILAHTSLTLLVHTVSPRHFAREDKSTCPISTYWYAFTPIFVWPLARASRVCALFSARLFT
jgi:hypothetical protein